MDLCECLSTKMAMERLLAYLRVTQNHCTDSECIPDMPNALTTEPETFDNGFFLMFMGMMFAVLLFLTRARDNDARPQHATKTRGSDDDSHGAPPNPPAPMF